MSEEEAYLCVACGEVHAWPSTATRIGISYVAADCAWTLRYPGMNAAEVIAALEQQLQGEAVAKAIDDAEAMPPPVGSARDNGVSDDPADRAESNEYLREALCPVCGGDGYLANADEPTVACGRCNGSGKIVVSP